MIVQAAWRRVCARTAFVGTLFFLALPGMAAGFTVFGPETFTRSTGKPIPEVRHFSSHDETGTMTVHVDRVASAVITLNGTQIFGPDDFNDEVTFLESQVTLLADNVLEVEDRGQPGGTLTIEVTVPTPPISVAVGSPAPGATVDADHVLVTGTFEGPAGTGITVNDAVAQIFGDSFYANVPLVVGENTLTVTATTRDGVSTSSSLTVFSTRASAFEAEARPAAGLAPLRVGFRVRDVDGAGIQRIDIDFDGDGAVDVTSDDSAAPIEHTYDAPGLYLARVTVTDDALDASFAEVLPILVRSPAEVDRFFAALWEGMNDALLAGDVPTALTYLSPSARERYRPAFEELLPDFATIVAGYSALQRVAISEDLAEYAINRTIDGENRIFLIYFPRDADGVWRLDSM